MLFAYYPSLLFQIQIENYVSFDFPVVPAAFPNAVGFTVIEPDTGAKTFAFARKRRTAGRNETFGYRRRQKAQLHRNNGLYAPKGR